MNGSVGSRIEDSLLTVFCLLLPGEEWEEEGELVPLVLSKLQNREAIEKMKGDGRASEEYCQCALRIANVQKDLTLPLFRYLGRGLHSKLLNVSLGSSEYSLFIGLLYIIMKYYFQGSELFCDFCYAYLEKKEVEAGCLMVLLCYQSSAHNCLS